MRLGRTDVLRDVSLHVPTGRWVGLVGPNGSGKTTLLRAVSGHVRYRGSLEVAGREVRSFRARALARRVAHVRQSPGESLALSVRDVVLLGRAAHRGWFAPFTADDHARAEAAAGAVGLGAHSDRPVDRLSGGERQRAFLAQAVAQDPLLYLLDEPTTHLDIHHQLRFLDDVAVLVAGGRTVLAVFHDLALAARYADALVVLDAGRIAAAGAPSDVLTPDLLRDVFHIRADVTERNGRLHVDYLQPVPTPNEHARR